MSMMIQVHVIVHETNKVYYISYNDYQKKCHHYNEDLTKLCSGKGTTRSRDISKLPGWLGKIENQI